MHQSVDPDDLWVDKWTKAWLDSDAVALAVLLETKPAWITHYMVDWSRVSTESWLRVLHNIDDMVKWMQMEGWWHFRPIVASLNKSQGFANRNLNGELP